MYKTLWAGGGDSNNRQVCDSNHDRWSPLDTNNKEDHKKILYAVLFVNNYVCNNEFHLK